jgi:hypothetical protein
MAMFKPSVEIMRQGTTKIPDPPVFVSYALIGLAAEGYPRDEVTDAMARLIASKQLPDGSFRVIPARPPLESSDFTAAALSIRALQLYGNDPATPIARAKEWLQNAAPKTHEDRVMQLLGLSWAKAGAPQLNKLARTILAEQRPDGGWSQTATLETDAYATGQALVALNLAGQFATSDPAYQRGVAYLLRTQLSDGSWLVRSRAFPIQPYKESGFPHGKNQWISASGSSWAAMALSLTQPVTGPQVSKLY